MNAYVSDAVVRRLPRYRRYLLKLKNNGVTRISSKELGEIMDVTASQIRQDLNHFGGFGQQGYGYSVDDLIVKLEEIMGINKVYRVGVIGCGRLGQSLIKYIKQEPIYKIVALCDNRPEMIGTEVEGVVVDDKETFKKRYKSEIDILILAVSGTRLEEIEEDLKGSNVKGIWNFSMTEINVKGIHTMDVHLTDSLHSLCYYINHPD